MNDIISTKYTETEDNWLKTISTDGVSFIGTNLLTSAIWNAYKVIKWEKETEKFLFDWEREFLRFSGNYFIVKYKNKSLRDSDKEKISQIWDFDKFWKAKKDKNWYQVPKSDFVVDYDWSYYLMIKWTLALDEHLIDIDKWVFKSMIIDIDKFNCIWKEIIYNKARTDEIIK